MVCFSQKVNINFFVFTEVVNVGFKIPETFGYQPRNLRLEFKQVTNDS